MRNNFDDFNLEQYEKNILKYGIKEVWKDICNYILSKRYKNYGILSIENIGELYEIGLAIKNKEDKKKTGQYYTPKDVALIMSEWFDKLDGDVICDIGCGTGNLILTYFEFIGEEKTKKVIHNNMLYLYDLDDIALLILKTIIMYKYKCKSENIKCFACDFLKKI